MERTTIRLPAAQLRRVERAVEDGEFPDRSAAIRAAVRQRFGDGASAPTAAPDGGHEQDDPLAASVEELAGAVEMLARAQRGGERR